MKNKIDDLRNHLFAQLERLGNEDLHGEALEAELKRAKAVKEVATAITDTARAETDRIRLVGDIGVGAGTALLGHAERSAKALEPPA